MMGYAGGREGDYLRRQRGLQVSGCWVRQTMVMWSGVWANTLCVGGSGRRRMTCHIVFSFWVFWGSYTEWNGFTSVWKLLKEAQCWTGCTRPRVWELAERWCEKRKDQKTRRWNCWQFRPIWRETLSTQHISYMGHFKSLHRCVKYSIWGILNLYTAV